MMYVSVTFDYELFLEIISVHMMKCFFNLRML